MQNFKNLQMGVPSPSPNISKSILIIRFLWNFVCNNFKPHHDSRTTASSMVRKLFFLTFKALYLLTKIRSRKQEQAACITVILATKVFYVRRTGEILLKSNHN